MIDRDSNGYISLTTHELDENEKNGRGKKRSYVAGRGSRVRGESGRVGYNSGSKREFISNGRNGIGGDRDRSYRPQRRVFRDEEQRNDSGYRGGRSQYVRPEHENNEGRGGGARNRGFGGERGIGNAPRKPFKSVGVSKLRGGRTRDEFAYFGGRESSEKNSGYSKREQVSGYENSNRDYHEHPEKRNRYSKEVNFKNKDSGSKVPYRKSFVGRDVKALEFDEPRNGSGDKVSGDKDTSFRIKRPLMPRASRGRIFKEKK